MKILNAKDLKQPWLHVFLWGRLGTGKTTCASTFPFPLFICPDNEGSITTLRGLDVPYIAISGPDGMQEAVEYLEQHTHTFESRLDAAKAVTPEDVLAIREETMPCDTVVIESVSHYMDLLIEAVTDEGKRQMDQSKWGLVRSHFRNLQARLRRLPVHVVYTSLEDTVVDADGRPAGGRPLVSGGTKTMLPAACDIVGYCTLRPGNPPVYEVHFRTYQQHDARTRFREMPSKVRDFAFDKIAEFIS